VAVRDGRKRVGDVVARGREDVGAGSGAVAAGGGLVDVVLQDRVGDGAGGADAEAEGHAADRAPPDTPAAEERVEEVVEDRADYGRLVRWAHRDVLGKGQKTHKRQWQPGSGCQTDRWAHRW